DSAGSGRSTAQPRAANSHGFQRQDQPLKLMYGPPCTHSMRGAGDSAEASSGRTSQERIVVPSSTVVSISVSVPGICNSEPGVGRRTGRPSTASVSRRTGVGGASQASRSAYTYRPFGDGFSSL